MRKFKQQFLAGPYLIWIIGFILLPLIMILYYAFTNGDGSFTLSYITAIADETNRKAMGLSLRLGIICTIVCLVLSYPLAMILNNMKIKNQGLVVFIFMLPMWMNFMLRILAWKLLLSKNGVINSILTGFGLSRINIINTPTAVVLGMVYDFLPFMLLPQQFRHTHTAVFLYLPYWQISRYPVPQRWKSLPEKQMKIPEKQEP